MHNQDSNSDGIAPDPTGWLVALVHGSDDAIVSKNLNGVIQSWNGGANRLFGYSGDEAIGKPIAILIPEDRLEEEAAILTQIQHGKRVDHLETKRRRKDGSLIDVSLTISAIRNNDGVVVGASKIARDITERLIVQERQQLLVREMSHRVKNMLALASAIVSISARSSGIGTDVIADILKRLSLLARAHDLTMADQPHELERGQTLSLLTLAQRILDPYSAVNGQVVIRGSDCDIGAKAALYLSLVLYEWATNAAKYGSLSNENGRLDVNVAIDGDLVRLVWQETGGPAPSTSGPAGFGSQLERVVACALNTTIERDWRLTGLVATMTTPKLALSV